LGFTGSTAQARGSVVRQWRGARSVSRYALALAPSGEKVAAKPGADGCSAFAWR
jgi:hypothetical protein